MKTTKKLIAVILTVLMAISMMPFTALADDVSFTKVTSVGDITTENIRTCTAEDAKAWALANWDVAHDNVHDTHLAFYSNTGELNVVLVDSGMNEKSFSKNFDYWINTDYSIDQLKTWYANGHAICICTASASAPEEPAGGAAEDGTLVDTVIKIGDTLTLDGDYFEFAPGLSTSTTADLELYQISYDEYYNAWLFTFMPNDIVFLVEGDKTPKPDGLYVSGGNGTKSHPYTFALHYGPTPSEPEQSDDNLVKVTNWTPIASSDFTKLSSAVTNGSLGQVATYNNQGNPMTWTTEIWLDNGNASLSSDGALYIPDGYIYLTGYTGGSAPITGHNQWKVDFGFRFKNADSANFWSDANDNYGFMKFFVNTSSLENQYDKNAVNCYFCQNVNGVCYATADDGHNAGTKSKATSLCADNGNLSVGENYHYIAEFTGDRFKAYVTDDSGNVVQNIADTTEETFISRLNSIKTETITSFKIGDDNHNYYFKGLEYRNLVLYSGETQYVPAEPNNGTNITVADTISENFYLDDEFYGEDAFVAVNYNHNSNVSEDPDFQTEIKAMSALSELNDSTSPYDGARILSVLQAPAQSTETITINVYPTEADAQAGTNAIGNPIEYSVYSYCRQIIEGEYNENLKALAKSTLDYAAASQLYFNYNTDNMATADNSGNAFYGDVADFDMNTVSASASAPSCIQSFSVVVKSDLEINLLSRTPISVESANLDTTKGGERFDATGYQNGDWYVVHLAGIEPANMDNTFTVVTDKGTISMSANAIMKLMAKSTDTNLVTLAKAMYLYGAAANANFD